jgi:hypothetical protein
VEPRDSKVWSWFRGTRNQEWLCWRELAAQAIRQQLLSHLETSLAQVIN